MMDATTARTLPRTWKLDAERLRLVAAPPRRTAVNRRLSARVALGWCAAASLLPACGTTATVRGFDIDVRVESDPAKPLAAASILHGGAELGRTAKDGAVRITLQGQSGDVVSLRVVCPEGYASPAKPLAITLRPWAGATIVPQYLARCEPLLRHLVLAVRAKGGANLPLKHLGREITRTDADGAAHALLRVAPAEQVTVVLDTAGPGHERLRPKSPEVTFVMPARDHVAVLDQAFTEVAPPVAKRRWRARRALGPVKIERRP